MSVIELAEDYERACRKLADECSSPRRDYANFAIASFFFTLHEILSSEMSGAPETERDIQEQIVLSELSRSVDLLFPQSLEALRMGVARTRSIFLHPDCDEFDALVQAIKQVAERIQSARTQKSLTKIDKAILISIGEINFLIWNELERQKRPLPTL